MKTVKCAKKYRYTCNGIRQIYVQPRRYSTIAIKLAFRRAHKQFQSARLFPQTQGALGKSD